MFTIWKYTIPIIKDVTVHHIPVPGEILSCQMQNGVPTIWVLVSTTALAEERRFRVYGTGHRMLPHSEYVGTVQDQEFVWHIFEVK